MCENKHIALVNNFGDTEKTIERQERDGAINVRSIYNVAKENQKTNNLGVFENMKVSQLDNRVDQFMDRTRESERIDESDQQIRARTQCMSHLFQHLFYLRSDHYLKHRSTIKIVSTLQ